MGRLLCNISLTVKKYVLRKSPVAAPKKVITFFIANKAFSVFRF